MTTSSISHSVRCAAASSLVAVLPVLALDANQAGALSAAAKLASRIVSRVQFPPETRPQWARFSPGNSGLVLVDLGGRGVLVSPQGSTRPIGEGLTPVGWLGDTLVVRDQKGLFRLLDAGTLTAASDLSLGSLPLAWTLGKDRRLQFDLGLPETDTAGIPELIPGAARNGRRVSAREDQAALTIAADKTGRNIVDAAGRSVFSGSKRIYKISLSPDAYKILVYYGNTEYVVYNRLTRRTIPLPTAVHDWSWLPDSATLLGEVSSGSKSSREEVTSTALYAYELVGGRMWQIVLPTPAEGVALKILDVASDGRILIDAERVVSKPAYLGLMILEVLWP